MGGCASRCTNYSDSYCGGCLAYQDCQGCYENTYGGALSGDACEYAQNLTYKCEDNSGKVFGMVVAPIVVGILLICLVVFLYYYRRHQKAMAEWARANPVGAQAGGVPINGMNAVAVKTLQCPVCKNLCQPPAAVPAITCPTCHSIVTVPNDFFSVAINPAQAQHPPQAQAQPQDIQMQAMGNSGSAGQAAGANVVVVQPSNSTADWDAQKAAAAPAAK